MSLPIYITNPEHMAGIPSKTTIRIPPKPQVVEPTPEPAQKPIKKPRK